jgi:glycosyltransferase involved in cell wall biosynthesis
MSQQPSVAIVIPAHNEERFIGKCLASCIDQTSTPDEIIVVNNKSTDNTVSIVRRYQEENPHIDIRLIDQNEYQGIAPTRNCGFDHAESDIIGRTDADAIVANDWVETIRRRFQDPAIDAASGPVLLYDMPLRGFLFWLDCTLRENLYSKAKDERFLIGANMAIRAPAWKAVRHLTQLDLEDRLHEDVDLALTLFKNNFEIAYEPTMVAGMSGRRAESSLPDFYRYVTRYTRTTKLHGIKSPTAHTTIITLLLLYYPFRTMRFFYDVENLQFTFAKLRDEFPKISGVLPHHRKHGFAKRELLSGAQPSL